MYIQSVVSCSRIFVNEMLLHDIYQPFCLKNSVLRYMLQKHGFVIYAHMQNINMLAIFS